MSRFGSAFDNTGRPNHEWVPGRAGMLKECGVKRCRKPKSEHGQKPAPAAKV